MIYFFGDPKEQIQVNALWCDIATTIWLTVRHGKIRHAIKFGKPSISMGHLYHGYVQ